MIVLLLYISYTIDLNEPILANGRWFQRCFLMARNCTSTCRPSVSLTCVYYIHSFISNIYIAPLQQNYSEAKYIQVTGSQVTCYSHACIIYKSQGRCMSSNQLCLNPSKYRDVNVVRAHIRLYKLLLRYGLCCSEFLTRILSR